MAGLPNAGLRESHSVRRIRHLAELVGAQSYLEVGVAAGKTFNSLDFTRKVAVDPTFRFDTREFQREGVQFHEMSSDEYFRTTAHGERFDLIFLDGLHTYPQTFRDFCNSLSVAHSDTVWIIDDVVPSDVYSAWPDKNECLEARRTAGGTSRAWHGDVYKVLITLHDFFPVLSYRTMQSDNPQALVWRQPRDSFAPGFNSLEAIERLGYFELMRRTDLLHLVSESEAFAALAAWRAEAGAGIATTTASSERYR